MPRETFSSLEDKYREAESADNRLYAEQRSNVLLVTGNHYSNKNYKYLERLRDGKKITNQAKIRLTKNHISRITKMYVNAILNNAPMVQILPHNEKEYADRKAAEMHQSVWNHIKQTHKMQERIAQYASDFIEIGECFVKVFWDPEKGKPYPVEQVVDQFGNVLEEIQMMSGDLTYERIYGFNYFRDPAAADLEDARWAGLRKMVDVKELKERHKDDDKKLAFITESSKETYQIFRGDGYDFSSKENKTLIKEFYFKPSIEYPDGYFFHITTKGILEEGPLPGGLFPIVSVGFDRIPTSPRFQSIIKQLRPYQGEINRSASKMAEHQVTLGDDKVFIQAGTKIAQGGTIAGIRGIQYTGTKPEILQGRTGSQYLEYMISQIDEMYKVANVFEEYQEKVTGKQDAFAALFKSMRDKKKFSFYAEKFERFLKELCELSLRLYKIHSIPQQIIPAIGADDAINISTFKSSEDLGYEINIEPGSGDLDGIAGKQLLLQNLLQYSSGQLSPQDIGQVIRNMPFSNDEEILSDLTIDYDNSQNLILKLDKGVQVNPAKADNHEYILKKLNHRMKQGSFEVLPEQVQMLYGKQVEAHEQALAEQQRQIQEASLGFIPTGGVLIGVDYFVQYDPEDPTKSRRSRIPFEAMDWLVKRLDKQGLSQQSIEQLDPNTQAGVARQMLAQGQQAPSQEG